jgi:hypothetical protein
MTSTAMPTRQQNFGASKVDRSQAVDCLAHWEDEEHLAENQAAYKAFQAEARKAAAAIDTDSKSSQEQSKSQAGSDKQHRSSIHKDHGDVALGMKRGRGANHQAPPGSKRARSDADNSSDEPDMPMGDKTRVPGQGQKVHWKADGGAGYVHGEVAEVLYANKTVGGESIEASKEDPMLLLKSGEREEVRKPEEVYFD